MLNDKNKKEFKQLFQSKSLYGALGLCVLAAGIFGISKTQNADIQIKDDALTATNSVTQTREVHFHDEISEATIINQVEISTSQEPFSEEETQIKSVFDNTDENKESPTENQASIQYTLPLSGISGQDYSMGIPVFSTTMSDYRTHNGVDFVGEYGEGVKAIANGTVTSVYKDNVWGNTVEIDHGQNVVSKISGLQDEGLIGVGSQVYEESIIGCVGNIPVEAAEGAHIHLEIRVNGELQDPLTIMGYGENTDE